MDLAVSEPSQNCYNLEESISALVSPRVLLSLLSVCDYSLLKYDWTVKFCSIVHSGECNFSMFPDEATQHEMNCLVYIWMCHLDTGDPVRVNEGPQGLWVLCDWPTHHSWKGQVTKIVTREVVYYILSGIPRAPQKCFWSNLRVEFLGENHLFLFCEKVPNQTLWIS